MNKTLREILKEKNIAQSVVAEALNIKPTNLVRYDNLQKRSLEEVSVISKATGIDISELIGCDFNINTQNKKEGYITYLLPMSAMGGSLIGFTEPGVMLQNCEAIVSPIENVDFAITVYGESMAPEYPSGSRILIKKINPDIFIDWGKIYVLDTPNGVVVKEVHESNKEGFISCYSINPDPKFKPFDIPANKIFGMYRVLMCLSAK